MVAVVYSVKFFITIFRAVNKFVFCTFVFMEFFFAACGDSDDLPNATPNVKIGLLTDSRDGQFYRI